MPRSRINISATKIREMLIKDDRKQWMQFVDPKLHKMYDRLRAELMAVDYYREQYENMMKGA